MNPASPLALASLVVGLGLAQVRAAQPPPVTAAPASPAARVVIDKTPSISGVATPDNLPVLATAKATKAVKLTPTAFSEIGAEPASAALTMTSAAKRTMTSTRTCKAADLKLAWPLAGSPGKIWVTHNYTDQDSTANKRDYRGAMHNLAMTYDGHRGYDIDVGSFRQMDANAVVANAAAPGKVIKVEDTKFDRNMSCTGDANYVEVEHKNGFITRYLHIKKGSLKVKVDDQVTTGQAVGVVGSSGCSTAPHLHFEVRDCENDWVEPAKEGMWTADPATYEVSGILDVMLRVGSSISYEQIADPAPNPATIKNNQMITVGFSGALRGGDEVTSRMFAVNGGPELTKEHTFTVTGRYGQRWMAWTSYLFPGYTGPVLFSLFVNGEVKAIRGFMVTAP